MIRRLGVSDLRLLEAAGWSFVFEIQGRDGGLAEGLQELVLGHGGTQLFHKINFPPGQGSVRESARRNGINGVEDAAEWLVGGGAGQGAEIL